ncbi:MAG: hypothetical protein ACI9BW_002582 [Gammaproteobacteria bacterium]|jgi:hypothetical protein
MNWEAAGVIAEVVGAIAVVLTLVYLAVQVRYARNETIDQNRLTRSTAVREIILATTANDDFRSGQIRHWGLGEYYETLAKKLGITSVEASRNEWGDQYYFWMYWGQWTATNDPDDLRELKHIIQTLFALPGMRHTWDSSPLGKVLLDERFVEFVDEVLDEEMK